MDALRGAQIQTSKSTAVAFMNIGITTTQLQGIQMEIFAVFSLSGHIASFLGVPFKFNLVSVIAPATFKMCDCFSVFVAV